MPTALRTARLATPWPRRWRKATPAGKGGFHGYYFKILKGQGPAAPIGTIDYVIEGVMIGGFALVAVPAEYRVTGVKTFIVNNDGIVYQKDLGPDSLNIVKKWSSTIRTRPGSRPTTNGRRA